MKMKIQNVFNIEDEKERTPMAWVKIDYTFHVQEIKEESTHPNTDQIISPSILDVYLLLWLEQWGTQNPNVEKWNLPIFYKYEGMSLEAWTRWAHQKSS